MIQTQCSGTPNVALLTTDPRATLKGVLWKPTLTTGKSHYWQTCFWKMFNHVASCLTSFSKSRSYLVKSILEQYFQLFSEYTESPVLFANLDQRTNKSNLSASAKLCIWSWRQISGYALAWTVWARLHQMVEIRAKFYNVILPVPSKWTIDSGLSCPMVLGKVSAPQVSTRAWVTSCAADKHFKCSFSICKWKPTPSLA